MESIMMDKKPHVKPYLYGMLAGFGAISLSIIFFFLIYRFDGFGDAISTLTGILMPFIYGAVIAYLLKPVCNTIESFLRRFIPEKMHGLVNVLSITLTILFGLLLIYALCMMIIPQLITSVTTLYYTAQRNLAKFVQWANHVEFIENNQQIMDMLNSAYATISTNIDDLIKTRLLPSMQNIVSGAAAGVLNVVTMAKNLIIGIIVAVYMLASRKRFVQQAKLVLYSIFKPRWAELIKEEVKYADKMFGGFINGKIMEMPLKTKNAYRTLPLSADAIDVLMQQRRKTGNSEWVFPSPTGGPMSPDSVLHMLHRVLKRAGLPKVRFHDLRHTFATLALQNGVDIKTVSGMLGHFSAGFTLDTYAHVTTSAKREAAKTMGNILSGAV